MEHGGSNCVIDFALITQIIPNLNESQLLQPSPALHCVLWSSYAGGLTVRDDFMSYCTHHVIDVTANIRLELSLLLPLKMSSLTIDQS